MTSTSGSSTSSVTVTSLSISNTSGTSTSRTLTSSTESSSISSTTSTSSGSSSVTGSTKIASDTIQNNLSNSEVPLQLSGSILASFSAPGAFGNDPLAAEKVLNSFRLTISQVVSIPASYISVWYLKSRRVRAATRQLIGDTFEVEFNISVPSDSAADVPDVVDAEASLTYVSII
ncbi:unnamed protein product [Prorocentrum cordatum]|uniref:Uncharacterized protein n=1 Tax=Prorocentrum cordatum TaxID=2364126 RepID=A0ABN9UMV4_9DINO|nr:unnamed protein product [Polarella glacialis]